MMTGISQRPNPGPVPDLMGAFGEEDNGLSDKNNTISPTSTVDMHQLQLQQQRQQQQQQQVQQQHSHQHHHHHHNHNHSHAHQQPQQEQIPKLGEILADQVDPESVYSKINFVKFLVDKHCIENYEFYTELASIIENYELFRRYNSTCEWFSIYNQFIETEIINLPADITLKLSKNSLPCLFLLNKIEKIIMNFLLASYYEFISYTKDLLSAKIRTSSSCSTSTTNSTNNTSSSCFTKLNSSLSPDSTSVCSDFSFYFLSEGESRSTHDHQEPVKSNVDVSGDISGKDRMLLSSKILDTGDCCACDGSCLNNSGEIKSAESKDSASRSRSATTSALNRDASGSAEISGNVSSSCNDVTLKSDTSSDSSVSNMTVCDKCDGRCENRGGESKSWSRFTRKLKWRRKSES